MCGAGEIPNGKRRNLPGMSISCPTARSLTLIGGAFRFAAATATP